MSSLAWLIHSSAIAPLCVIHEFSMSASVHVPHGLPQDSVLGHFSTACRPTRLNIALSLLPMLRMVWYSRIYLAPLNSRRPTEALLVRLAPRKETSFKK